MAKKKIEKNLTIDELAELTANAFSEQAKFVTKQFEQQNTWIKGKFAEVDRRFTSVDGKFASVNYRLDRIETRLDHIEDDIKSIRKVLDSFALKFDKLDKKNIYFSKRLVQLEDEISTIKQYLKLA